MSSRDYSRPTQNPLVKGMRTESRIYGADRLMSALKYALEFNNPKEIRKLLTPSAQMIVEAAQGYAPRATKPHTFTTRAGEKITIQPGNLKKSIKILPIYRKVPHMVFVGPKIARKNAAKASVNGYYAHFVEYGTASHNLGYKGKRLEVKGAQHPGSTKKPFMRPALDSVGQQAVAKAINVIEKMIIDKVGKGSFNESYHGRSYGDSE